MSRRYYRLIGPIARIRGKDVFLTEHAAVNIKLYHISMDRVINAIRNPDEKFIDKTKPSRMKGFKRYAIVKQMSKNRFLIVIIEKDGAIIVVTSFEIHDRKRYERHRKNKIRKKEWIKP